MLKLQGKWCNTILFNQQFSEDTKNKVRLWNLGKKYSEETKAKKYKAVIQLSTHGNIIEEFVSLKSASEKTGATKGAIQNAYVGRCKTAGGYKWKYKQYKIQSNPQRNLQVVMKMIDNVLTLEGLYSIVLFGKVKKDKEKGVRYVFETQNNGENTCKSPKGMFETVDIPNDLNLVKQHIINYEK